MRWRMRYLELGSLIVLSASIAACGISKKDHDRLVGEALAEQKAKYDAEIKKNNAAHAQEIGAKNTRIQSLENDMNKLGIDMKKTQSEMSSQLASTQAQI